MKIHNAIMLLALLSSPALAQSSQCTQTFCIQFPSEWEARVRGSTLQITDPDNTISVELRTVTQASQFAQARRDYEAELVSHATNLRWDNDGQRVEQFGFQGVVRRGRGMINGRRMIFFMLGLANNTGGVVGAGVIVEGASQEEVNQVIAALNTIRPAH